MNTQEKLETGQGTVVPTMFVGLGGVGSRIVDRIAARAAFLPNWKEIAGLTCFVSIDTNQLDQQKLRYIATGNRIQIGAFDKRATLAGYRSADNQQALHWVDPRYQPREGTNLPGAGQIRVESRLGFFHQSPTIWRRFSQLTEQLLEAGKTARDKNSFYVYLFSSLAGGTGSGSFLSAAYLLRELIQHAGSRQPRFIGNFLLSTLLTNAVPAKQHATIHGNTYAALKELEHLMKLNYPQVRSEGRTSEQFAYYHDKDTSEPRRVDSGPFYLSFIYDKHADFALENVEKAIADTCFLQLFTPLINDYAGALDNYQRHMQQLSQLPGELKSVGLGYAMHYGTQGAAALVLPARDLLEYSALRFAAEALRSQITFGRSTDGRADDRARALAKLGVDYADPKFLGKSDKGRNQVINQSFVNSVQEMKRQDERAELLDGFWYQLVESIDEGKATTNEQGEVLHGESRMQLVRRKLEESRQAVLDKVKIVERDLALHRENVGSYMEKVSRLEEEIRAGRVIVREQTEGLKRAAREGEVVTDLKLDPIAERYLVLRLLAKCEQKWIPEAQKQYDAAKLRDISNPKVRERLRDELFKSLQQAAKRTLREKILRNDDEFYGVVAEALEYYRAVAAAAKKLFDAETALAQFRELSDYLDRRARLYADLARYMNELVNELEKEAEEYRKGQAGEPRFALSVEVFETLQEPKERIWDRIYSNLFVDEGRYLNTFDRTQLASAIARELRPELRADGVEVEKPVDKVVADLRGALVALGRERLRSVIFGGRADRGLNLPRGLELEARLELEKARGEHATISDSDIEQYCAKKFKALAQISGVFARLDIDTFQPRQDGVPADRSRYLEHGLGEDSDFARQLTSVLQEGGQQINHCKGDDPNLAVVYDVVAPIALYYVRPVVGELQQAYQTLRADGKHSFQLHTDYHWEESLPNLNPMQSEIEVGWAIRKLAEGLVTGVIEQTNTAWVWKRKRASGESSPRELGTTLSAALYWLGEFHRAPEIRDAIDGQIKKEMAALSKEEKSNRQSKWSAAISTTLEDIELRRQDGKNTREDFLDPPILRVLRKLLEQEILASSAATGGYQLRT